MITLSGAGAILRNSDGNVFMVRIERRGMIRWELPTRIRRNGESIFITLYRCIEEESSSKIVASIGRPVCIGLNSSPTLSYSYFAMFFECRAEANDIKLTENADPHIPEISRQKVITSAFLDWRSLPVREIHPQHREILSRWDQGANGSFFSIASDADDELVFYNSLTSAEMDISNNVPRYTVPGEDLINIREHIFDVAFSFPGEKREHIKPVVEEISKRLGKNKVFYDKYYQSQLSQPSLNTLLEHIYKRSKVVVAFLCAEYQSKEWCGMEMRGILEMIMERKEYKIMLIRMDDSKIDGIYKTDGYIDFWEYKTDAIANLIQERIKLQK